MDDLPRDIVIERLEALERGNRRLWCVGTGAIVVAAIFFAEWTSPTHHPKIVEAEGFVLKDTSGRVRGRLKTIEDGSPQFSLLDEQGQDRVNLHTTSNNSSSLFFYDYGVPRVELTASSGGSAQFRMSADGNESNMALYLRGDGTTGQAFVNGDRAIYVGVQPDGMAGLCVLEARGEEHGRIGMLPDQVQWLRLQSMINEPGPAPFRRRVEPVTERPSPPRPPDSQADRTDGGAKVVRHSKRDRSDLGTH